MTNTIRRLGIGAALLLLFAACSSADDAVETSITAAPTTTIETTATTAVPVTTATTAVQAEGTSCVDCHTDEDTLKALAVEPPETEHLSEGEG